MGKDTKSDFLSQILWKLWSIKYLAHLDQMVISFFAYMTETLLKGCWSGTFLSLIHMICRVNNVKFDM